MSSHTLAKSSAGDALNVNKLFSVDGWVAVVTGGGTGLGLTTAIALAANGAKVYITGRRAEVLEKAVETATPKSGNGSVHAVQGDAATKEGIESACWMAGPIVCDDGPRTDQLNLCRDGPGDLEQGKVHQRLDQQ